MAKGKIKKIDKKNRCGELQTLSGEIKHDFYAKSLENKNEFETLKVGDIVVFTFTKTKKGLIPIKIKKSDVFTNKFSEKDAYILDELFESKKHLEFLCSDAFVKYPPNELPIEYIEKALTCAKRLLTGNEENDIKLNVFQKTLFELINSKDFAIKKKINGAFDKNTIKYCQESSLFGIFKGEKPFTIAKFLNNIGLNKNTLNNNYTGLCERFSACRNELTPYVYVLRLLSSTTTSQLERVLYEYCKFIETINDDNRQNNTKITATLSKDRKLCYLSEIIRIALVKFKELNNSPSEMLCTKLISEFVDFDFVQDNKCLLESIASDDEKLLINIISNCDSITEENIKFLFEKKINLQLFQKSCALALNYNYNSSISNKSLLILGWALNYGGIGFADEIIHYHSILSKKHTEALLVESFENVLEMLVEAKESSLFNLATYIFSYIYVNMKKEKFSETINKKFEEWTDISREIFETHCSKLHDKATSSEYMYIIRMVALNPEYSKIVQEKYATYRMNSFEYQTKEDVDNLLEEFYAGKLFYAYSKTYNDYDFCVNSVNNHALEYISVLTGLNRFGELISFIEKDSALTDELKEKELIEAICQNFGTNGLSDKSFSIYNDHFSIQDAINLLEKHYFAEPHNKYPWINALMMLYARNNELLKSIYLYNTFQKKAEIGHARLYEQFRSIYGKYFLNSIKKRQEVVLKAFNILSINELYNFFDWIKNIKITEREQEDKLPDYKSIEGLLGDSKSLEKWSKYLDILLKRPNENAWRVCVCEAVLNEKYGRELDDNFRKLLLLVIDDQENIPDNFLNVAVLCISNNFDKDLCRNIYKCLSDKSTWEKVYTNSPWSKEYLNPCESFFEYCISKNEGVESEFFKELIFSNREYLYKDICGFFLKGADKSTLRNLLNEYSAYTSSGANYEETEMFALLTVLCNDDDVLLCERPEMFESEKTVWNGKKTCAKILSAYPDYCNLNEFEKNNSIPISFKLLVFSHVCGVFYDDTIFDERKYEFIYDELIEKNFEKEYYLFLNKVYHSQLHHNTSYPFFYKRWRYLKLYILKILNNFSFDIKIDDEDIINEMHICGHYDSVYSKHYVPFKNIIKCFIDIESWNTIEKKRFLCSLMVGNFADYIINEDFVHALKKLSSDEKAIIEKVVSFVNFRNISKSLYAHIEKALTSSDYEDALNISVALSTHAYTVIDRIRRFNGDKEAIISLLKKCNSMDMSPARWVHEIICDTHFSETEYANIFAPLIFSIQLPLLVYGKFRSCIIGTSLNIYGENIKEIFDYAGDEGKSVHLYLCALQACIAGDKERASVYLSNKAYKKELIPIQWENEANNIETYITSDADDFVYDKAISINSEEKQGEVISLPTLEKIKEQYGIGSYLSVKEIKDAQDAFLKPTSNEDMFIAGLNLIYNYPIEPQEKLPAMNALILRTALVAFSKEISLSDYNKLSLVLEIIEHATDFSNDDKQLLNEMYFNFNKLMDSTLDIDLRGWCRLFEGIISFIETNKCSLPVETKNDIKTLFLEVILPCKKLYKEQVPITVIYNQISKIVVGASKFNISKVIQNSIKKECTMIEKGIFFELNINNNVIHKNNAKIHYTIKNIGNSTIDTSKISLLINNCIYVDRIEALPYVYRSQTIAGTVDIKLDNEEDIKFDIKAFYGDEKGKVLIDEKVESFSISSSTIQPYRVDVNTRKQFNTNNSAWEDGVEGINRDEIQKIEDALELKQCFVVYGASRVGKTSLLNYILNIRKGSSVQVLPNTQTDFFEDVFINSLRYAGMEKDVFENLKEKCYDSEKETDIANAIMSFLIEVSNTLSSNEICWILIDEFQQWLAKKDLSEDEATLFKNILMNLHKNKSIKIRYVFCGADEFVTKLKRQNKNDCWYEAFSKTECIDVKSLCVNGKVPQQQIKETLFRNSTYFPNGTPFTDSAIDYLLDIAGGNICMCKWYVYELLNSEVIPGSIYPAHIYSSIVKKTTNDAEKDTFEGLYCRGLSEIEKATAIKAASLWKENKPVTFSSISSTLKVLNTKDDENNEEIRKAIDILCIRSILKEDGSENGEKTYRFANDPHLTFFAALSLQNVSGVRDKNNTEEDLLVNTDPYEISVQICQKWADLSILKLAPDTDEDTKKAIDEAVIAIKKHIGDYNEYNTKQLNKDGGHGNMLEVAGDLNVYQIQNTFNTLLSGQANAEEFISALSQMPTVSGYLSKDGKKERIIELKSIISECEKEINESDTSHSKKIMCDKLIAETSEKLKKETEQAAEKVVQDSLSAITFNDIMNMDNPEKIASLLGIGQEKVDELKTIPHIQTQLSFALALHSIFNSIYTSELPSDASPQDKKRVNEAKKSMDFCPVAIMYCKIVEAMLKKGHTPLYISCLPDKTLGSGSDTFSSLGSFEHYNPKHPALTIGSFAFHLVNANIRLNNDNNTEFHFETSNGNNYEENIEKLRRSTGKAEETWKDHAKGLAYIKVIRNDSAHKAIPITKKIFDILIRELFEKGELLRIWELSQMHVNE